MTEQGLDREAQRQAEREAFKKQEQKKQFMIVGGVIFGIALSVWIVGATMKTHYGSQIEDRPIEEYTPPPPRKVIVEGLEGQEQPAQDGSSGIVETIKAAPAAERHFYNLFAALAKGDRRAVTNACILDEPKIDALMEKDRIALYAHSYQIRSYKVDIQTEAPKSKVTLLVPNKTGHDAERMVFQLEQQQIRSQWKVTAIDFQRLAGHPTQKAMSKLIPIDQDPTSIEIDPRIETTFKKTLELDPSEQPWLEGTTEEQKAQIKKHIADLFDLVHPANVSKASQALINIGKPSIPALLNELMKFDVRKEDDNKMANVIDRTLAAMTDREMGYDAVGLEGKVEGALPPAQARLRAVRRWFGWWSEHQKDPLPRRSNDDIEDGKKK